CLGFGSSHLYQSSACKAWRGYLVLPSNGDIASFRSLETPNKFTSQRLAGAFGRAPWMEKIVHWTSLRLSFSLDDSEGTSWRERHKYPMESASLLTQAEWQRALTNGQARAAELFGRPETEQKRLGYFHTLKELCQQPWTW